MTAPRHEAAGAPAVVVPLVPFTAAGCAAACARAESFITELTAAVSHLEQALEVGQTPARFLLPNGATVTEAQLCLWVEQHTTRAHSLLAQITAAYTD
ncbi:hypothetical protein ACN6LC_004506 [Streptomyces violaceoruber]|uniref:hypothetical protein n=1 Tax=Streptomyces violaceoruber group TaxID=2867121 RepID=UPI00340CDC45